MKGIIKSWNAGAEQIFGYTAAEIVGRPVTTLIPEAYQHEEPEILRRISAGERIDHYETIRQRKDGTQFPVSLTVSPIRDRGNAIVGASKIARDITESKQAQEQREVLMLEMHHRIKNLFAVASGIVTISARNAESVEDLARSIRERLTAMAHAHDLTVPNSAGSSEVFRPARFQDLARAVLSPYERSGDEHVIAFSGPPIEVGPKAATSLALLLHEFATNSVKYGALSNAQGKVSLDWAGQGDILLRWKETGGPPIVAPPQTEGFGATLSKLTAENLHGAIRRTWAPTGLEIEVKFPSSALDH